MIQDYQKRGEVYRSIDISKVQAESNLKFLPVSFDTMALKAKAEIASCDNFNGLKK